MPSFATPEHIRRAVANRLAVDPDIGKYALPDGLPELRQRVADKHFRETGVRIDPSTQVLITALICERLGRVPHVFQYARPEGAYYVFPRMVARHESSVAFAHRLLDRTGVSVTPGSAFGPTGEHHVRLAFCVKDAAIEQAFERIEAHFGG